jgi:hypothetical protein
VRARHAEAPFQLDLAPALARLGPLSERVSVLTDWQRSLWSRGRSAWIVLPSMRDGELCWLVIARDAEGERRAREVVAAFIGPTVGSLEAGRLRLTNAREPDGKLSDAGIEHIVLLVGGGDDTALVEALELMVAVRAGEPDLRRDADEPIGFLLRDFHLALSNGDPETSERLLDRLEATCLLASENLRFLRVERLARLARWHELGALPWFDDLSRARRPRHITEHLLEALWRRHFDEVAVVTAAGGALRRFEDLDIGSRYRSLVDAVDCPASLAGLRLVWLWAVLSGNAARQERLRAKVDDSERLALDRLAGLRQAEATPRTELRPLERARTLLDTGDFVGAVGLAEEARHTPELTTIAVRAAFELSDAELARRAFALVDIVGEECLPRTPGFLRSLGDVRRLALNRCSGWADWLRRTGAQDAWPDAAEVARELSGTWGAEELRDPATADRAANDLLDAAEGVNAVQVRAALDLICDLASASSQFAGASSFADAVLLVISMQDNPSAAVRNAFSALTADILATGPNAGRYRDLVMTAITLWERVRARDCVAWALDLADLLAASPAPDPATRASFVVSVGTGVADFAGRLAAHERVLLQGIANECGTAIALPPLPPGTVDATGDVWALLSNKLVGLYSLLDGVGARFTARLREINPLVDVQHNADTVATNVLRQLARTADYFIVDTRHAAHAATEAIDAVRSRDRQLFPSGRGLSSFIARLHDALEARAEDEAA